MFDTGNTKCSGSTWKGVCHSRADVTPGNRGAHEMLEAEGWPVQSVRQAKSIQCTQNLEKAIPTGAGCFSRSGLPHERGEVIKRRVAEDRLRNLDVR